MNPLVSIVIPGYNSAWCVPQLASNLRDCNLDGVEVIFVDDGSSDRCGELFQGLFPESRCLRQENQGVGAARNLGVSQAQGEFIQLLDADDEIDPVKIKLQREYLDRSGADLVYSDWKMCVDRRGERRFEPLVHSNSQSDIIGSLLGGWWFPTASALFRKSCYLSVGGCDPTLKNTCDDFHLWVQMAIHGARFNYLPGCESTYFRYEDRLSISRNNRLDFFTGEEKIVEGALVALEKTNKTTVPRKMAAARRLHSVARNVYAIDRGWYFRLMLRIRELDPDFSPIGSAQYRALWNFGGHQIAEWVACRLRK